MGVNKCGVGMVWGYVQVEMSVCDSVWVSVSEDGGVG